MSEASWECSGIPYYNENVANVIKIISNKALNNNDSSKCVEANWSPNPTVIKILLMKNICDDDVRVIY